MIESANYHLNNSDQFRAQCAVQKCLMSIKSLSISRYFHSLFCYETIKTTKWIKSNTFHPFFHSFHFNKKHKIVSKLHKYAYGLINTFKYILWVTDNGKLSSFIIFNEANDRDYVILLSLRMPFLSSLIKK